MNDVAAIRGAYAEQWLHEHRDELPDEIVEYIEGLRSDLAAQTDEIEELCCQFQRETHRNAELRKQVAAQSGTVKMKG